MIARVAIALALSVAVADAKPAEAPVLVALAPGATDDARQAIAIGPTGEVYAPDGKGAWLRSLPATTADRLTTVGRAGASVVAIGDGVVYRLADNGWSALRLVQRGKAILGAGTRAVAAVGKQLFALDGNTRGEPTKLAVAPANVVAIAAGRSGLVIATETSLLRLAPKSAKLTPVPKAPRKPRLISERWALTDRGPVDLTTMALARWPSGLAIGAAAAGPDDALVAIGATHAGLELVTVRPGGAIERDPLGLSGAAVGLVVDKQKRAVVALRDGRLAVRDARGWSTVAVAEAPRGERPGSGPAVSAEH